MVFFLFYRICSPHELSTIQEVDTPSTSRNATKLPLFSKSHKNDSNCLDDISLSDEKIEDIDLSFLTLKSNDDDDDISCISKDMTNNNDLNCSNLSLNSDGSMPDVMDELIRRGIIDSPFSWAKESDDDNNDVNNDNRYRQHHYYNKNDKCSFTFNENNFRNKKIPKTFSDDLSSSQMADEEVRGILKESSPEDIETAFENLGLGWASTTLRKTRQANELSNDSSSSNDFLNRSVYNQQSTVINCNRSKNKSNRNNISGGHITSTPDNLKSTIIKLDNKQFIPKNEPDISTVYSSSSDKKYSLTPPDISLKPRHLTLSNESIGSLS